MLIARGVLVSFVWASISAFVAAQNATTTPGPRLTINSGPVEGITLASGVKAFLGMPFAQTPPVRFAAPVDPAPWETWYNATKLEKACIQQFNYPEDTRNFTISVFSTPMPEESEDCLYINVWVPKISLPSGGQYSVLFWLYGGNLQFGTASMPEYDGEYIAATPFGFPNSPELPLGEANPGFLDQRKALEWVHSNIMNFGGDRNKVTIFGQSAGGWSVKQLVALPPNPVPFRAAIMQSEAAALSGGVTSWLRLSAALNCTGQKSLACVRAAPASKIKDVVEHEKLSFDPVKDDITCSKNILQALTSGKAAKVPFIIGSNADDGTAFAVTVGRMKPGTDVFRATSKSLTDIAFQCPAATIADVAANSGYNVYRFLFNASFPQYFPFEGAGAYHGGEIRPVFGTYIENRTDINRLSRSMQMKWTDFAKAPNSSLPGWPKVEVGKQSVFVFGNAEDSVVDATWIDQSCAGMAVDIALGGL